MTFQEQKKTKEPTHLIKCDYEVVKALGKRKKSNWGWSLGQRLPKVRTTDTKERIHTKAPPFLSTVMPGEVEMKQWKGRGIEETLSRTECECWCQQQVKQHRAEGSKLLQSSWHIHMAQSLSVVLDQVQEYSSAASALPLVPWSSENKPIVPPGLKCWAIILLS